MREAPVVLTCSWQVGQRGPGCWVGLRLLGMAPVTRVEGLVDGIRPADRPVYGGSDPRDSSGTLRYVRVEFAGAGAEAGSSGPAFGFYGTGDGTLIEYVQAHASLGDGIGFYGGTAACNYCVASGSGAAGLAWARGWQGTASHLYVQHGPGGVDGIRGDNDAEGYDLEPRSQPTLANTTVIHPGPPEGAAGLRLSTGTGLRAADLLVTGFGDGAIDATSRAALLFVQGTSDVRSAILHGNSYSQLRGGISSGVDFRDLDPALRNVRWEANPDPRPYDDSPARVAAMQEYVGAFGEENWLQQWTLFGPEQGYDPRHTNSPEE